MTVTSEDMPKKEINKDRNKYRYKTKTFALDEDIDIPSDTKILGSYIDYVCNHHEYENVEKDTITIRWLEPINKKDDTK